MEKQSAMQLHFDFVSCRALLSCEGRDYVLPDIYPNELAARAAAQKFAWEKLGLKTRHGPTHRESDLAIWMR